MDIERLTVAEKRRLPELPRQVLLRMGLIRNNVRCLCKRCGEMQLAELSYAGNDTWDLRCPEDGELLAHVDTDHVFTSTDPPFTPEDQGRKRHPTAEQITNGGEVG